MQPGIQLTVKEGQSSVYQPGIQLTVNEGQSSAEQPLSGSDIYNYPSVDGGSEYSEEYSDVNKEMKTMDIDQPEPLKFTDIIFQDDDSGDSDNDSGDNDYVPDSEEDSDIDDNDSGDRDNDPDNKEGSDIDDNTENEETIGSNDPSQPDIQPQAIQEEEDDMDGISCNHAPVDENLIIRDEKHPDIYVRKVLTTKLSPTGRKKSSTRVWNNYHCCFICKTLSTNIVKHMLTHKDNEETKRLISIKKSNTCSKDAAKNLQAVLRNKGDHAHNLSVKTAKRGEMIVAMKKGNFKADEYGPCPNCLQWIKIDKYRSKHNTICPARTHGHGENMSKGEALVRSSVLRGDIKEGPSKKLVAEVYPIMTRDDVTSVAKDDSLIVALGNNWFRRNQGNKLKRKTYTSSRMRGAARLLQNLRSVSKTEMSLNDYIAPGFFDQVCEAALLCASMENDDEEDLKCPTAAIKIGYDLQRMTNIKLGIAIRTENQKMKKECEDFLSLMRLDWRMKVSGMAYLRMRERKLNEPQKSLPIPEDLSVLGGNVISELKNLDLTKEGVDFKRYRRAVVLLQTRLLTYNKRRSGELEGLSLENYKMRSRGLDEADKGLLGDDLTELEQYLLDSQELIKIRGKNGKMVPILVPEDAQKPMEFITSTAVRRAVGVKTWNTFVFGNTGEGVIRAYDSLKEMCAELNLGAPERITSVSMRKYIATLSQVIDMKDHELEWLCSHLGHTSEIHKLHYRSTSGFIERVNIGKLMVLQDLNIAGHFKGQQLQDIDIEDISDIMNNQGIQEPPNAQRNQEQQEAASSSAATSSASTSSAATSSASTFEMEEESWGIEEYIEDEPSKAKKRKCNETRKAWTSEEEQELLQLFQVNFSSKKNPGMKECNSAISRSRKQHGFIHKRNWETIKKKVMRMFKSSK